jgi:hypothetical protein
MSGRADLHFHLLPGVDDGPADVADSIELAREGVAKGTDTFEEPLRLLARGLAARTVLAA